MPLITLAYVVYNVPKIITFYECIQLLQVKVKVGPLYFGPPCMLLHASRPRFGLQLASSTNYIRHHAYIPSSASMLIHTLVPRRGIHCRGTSARHHNGPRKLQDTLY